MPEYFALDEDYPVDPMDSYAMSKIINQATAKAFHARTAAHIHHLRIGNVIDPGFKPAHDRRSPVARRKPPNA